MKELIIVIKVTMMEKKDIILTILFGYMAGITAVGLFASSGYLISKAAITPTIFALSILIATVKLLGFTRAVSRYAERYFSHRATFTMLSNIRVTFFEKIEPIALRISQKYRSGDLLSRFVGDVESLQHLFLRVLYPPFVLVMVFFSTIFFTAFVNIQVAAVLFVGLVFTVIIVPAIFTLRQQKIDQHIREGRGKLSTEITEFLYGFRDLKIFRKLEQRSEQLQQLSDHYIEEQEREGINKLYSQSINSFVSLLIAWIVLSLGVYFVSNGDLSGMVLAMLVMISLTVFEGVVPMASFPIYFQDNQHAAQRLFSGIERDGEKSNMDKVHLDRTQPVDIKINNLSLTFPGEWRSTLKKVSIHIPAGSKVAIVGPSGSGKSTLLKLLLKFYTVEEGGIKINDTPIQKVNEESIWELANVVLQENHFFHGTVRDNLLLAKDGLTDMEMNLILSKVRLHTISLDDVVEEKGENLSGGEKQRLAIARAMLKGGQLWLLDEPTSSVDAVNEHHIFEHIFKEAKDDTLIFVSHRLTELERMDKIVVMDEDTIVESGSYEELMDRKGYFYEMKQIEKELFM
ncbi:thiol reductant ABC exporter subunit CydC [Salirhabdus salicampi]|uniref:thiol reductant ABC exporter subunit CydC n=1 Tax=Salirhabdus salicampi TaxID=476102 RepID=UPI0020C22C3A|nr:thiol reductant ABC exporter subunit CydC [Salirhabdus salicampi]MCP8615692.1 thiol reductant ABC exporter subunit CydC [Salirhabdus salicampi]